MGGSYKKKKRAEKAKVKLKGVKLPKGLNVTKTEFKIRKIIIREQLKDLKCVDGERHVHLNLKEILNRLKHHGSNFRLESLRKLRDAIAINNSSILVCLNEIIQNVASLCLDAEREIRKDSFKTLDSLLGSLTETSIAPFFHIISSYLRCAMTHLQPYIQEDSLLMLDVLLDHVPGLVAKDSQKIFQNFLEMISRVRAEGDKAGRMLTINMGKKQTNIKWRSKVLLRLQQMLSNLVKQKGREKNSHDLILMEREERKPKNTLTFNAKVPQYYGVKRSYQGNLACDLSSIFQRTISDSAMFGNVLINEEHNQLKSYVDHLMPLLLESWLEVRPQQSSKDGIGHLLNLDTAQTLKIILEIIANLWLLIDIHEEQINNNALSLWFQHKYKELFALNFLQAMYPYVLMEVEQEANGSKNLVSKRKSRKSSLPLPTWSCHSQNIFASYIMCRFFASSEQTKTHRDGTLLLLKSCVKSFLSHNFGDSSSSSKLLLLLCEIIQNSSLYKAYDCKELKQFLEFLPHLLLKSSISESTVLAMVQLGKQQNEVFLTTLKQLFNDVVTNLQRIQVNGALNAFEGKKLIINMFYWLNPQTLREEDLKIIMNNLNEHITDKRINEYCHYVLTLNINKNISFSYVFVFFGLKRSRTLVGFTKGDHIDTTPFPPPVHKTPLAGLCRIMRMPPMLVLKLPTNSPMDTSNQETYPSLFPSPNQMPLHGLSDRPIAFVHFALL
uniref:Ipi1_N domain-containing protein n=1 Tax=Glossina brevipalpis TaxID=37001 RepID=A0A1A9WZE0_9MUSC